MAVVTAWGLCLVGAVGFTVYLAVVAFRALAGGSRSTPAPQRGVVVALGVYAAVMAVLAGVLAALVLRGPGSGLARSALRWTALPLWSAATATATALALGRRRRRALVP